jgi:hypothetical protein
MNEMRIPVYWRTVTEHIGFPTLSAEGTLLIGHVLGEKENVSLPVYPRDHSVLGVRALNKLSWVTMSAAQAIAHARAGLDGLTFVDWDGRTAKLLDRTTVLDQVVEPVAVTLVQKIVESVQQQDACVLESVSEQSREEVVPRNKAGKPMSFVARFDGPPVLNSPVRNAMLSVPQIAPGGPLERSGVSKAEKVHAVPGTPSEPVQEPVRLEGDPEGTETLHVEFTKSTKKTWRFVEPYPNRFLPVSYDPGDLLEASKRFMVEKGQDLPEAPPEPVQETWRDRKSLL